MGKNRKEPFSIEPRGLSIPQAAAYYGISANAYRNLMRQGVVPEPIKIPGFERRIIDYEQVKASFDKLSGFARLSSERRHSAIEADLDQELEEFIHGQG